MPKLSWELVEQLLPIKPSFRVFKQRQIPFGLDLHPRIKDKIHQLLGANFIRPCRYADWVSNIVPVEKKDSNKTRVYIDFHNFKQRNF